jgi:hypothetical protein
MIGDKGSWSERWHYRQEMRAKGVWPHRFAFPTRQDYHNWLFVEDMQTRAAQRAERERESLLEPLGRDSDGREREETLPT